MNKRQRLLDEMIAIYIKDGEPIGSESLRLMVDIKISSATIRNYFKVLVDEGVLSQPHISSGRIPTNNTLKEYWRKKLSIKNTLIINNLSKIEFASKKYEIFCNIRFKKSGILKKVLNFENEYSILVFDNNEVVVPYSTHLHTFMQELIHQDIDDIKNIAKSVCANTLFKKLEYISNIEVFNFGYEFLNITNGSLILEIINSHIYYRLKNGFYFDLFPDGYLGIIQDIKLDDNYGKIFIFGKLRCNYEEFYNEVAS
ncbi:HrcA family transcriptional regulator [Helicobacter sp. MIT 14-3879]|uniref:HrcA family transcriptional regulator n=1 Tax=Helicobacter sp. MIT 14-3879 TaxID=2040649 RepID=UPI000E1F403E|nr:HrcA family transcriptional regulator [Helicobacter sp. MIT 14-3879]RDU62442.1 HrcA family transcriptional regulator [Helicobacter sp. MIT 14-3879]